MIPLVWLPLISTAVYLYSSEISGKGILSLFSLGMLYWTLVEYSLHRFVFHMDAVMPDWPIALSTHFILHGVHHKVPNDRYR